MNKLSEMIGVQLNTIWRWESERASPSVDMARALAVIFGITESELLNGPAFQNWELKLLVSKSRENEGGTVDMSGKSSTATLSVGDDAMAITMSADYSLWEDEAKFERLIEDLRRKRLLGLKMRKESW